MYLTLIYRDEYVRPDFPKKQFYSITKDLSIADTENLVNYWRMNPFIEAVYLNVKEYKINIKEYKANEKTNNINEQA